ncbi:MAG: hypothetical protein HY875_07335 [Chloroflexi bacterium]|nr:hypothetical protein [Chloroflexota bacterium]
MVRTARSGKFATIATLPLMAVAVLAFMRADFSSSVAPSSPPSGMLVVAGLRGDRLTIYDFGAGGAPLVLALPGPPHEIVESRGRLVITLGRGDALVEVDPHAPGILRVLHLAGEPHGLAQRGGELLVTLDKANALVTVDASSFTERARSGTGTTPHALATAAGAVYVTDSGDGVLREMTTGATAATGAQPESVAIAGAYVVTANAWGRSLSVFRRDGLALVGDVALDGIPVRAVTLPTGEVAVALSDAGNVAIVDPASLRVRRTIPVAARPDGICVSPAGDYAAVASNAEGRVDIFQLPSWKPVAALEAGAGPGSCLWFAASPGN